MKTLKPLTKSIKITFLIILPLFILMSAQIVYSMEIYTPKEGEIYATGSPLTITWGCMSDEIKMDVDYTIGLYKENTGIGDIGSAKCMPGSYQWVVGQIERTQRIAAPGRNYRIKILGVDRTGRTYEGWSGAFTISPAIKTMPSGEVGALKSLIELLSGPPTITGISPPDSVVEPGTVLNILGQNFGQSQGTVTMAGYFTTPLKIITWNDAVIMAEVPADITGVLDQWVSLQVVTNDNRISDKFHLRFVALRDLIRLPDSLVRTTHCGGGEFCDDSCGPGISGFHMTMCCFSGDSDQDRFSAGPFKNGWVIDSYHYWDYCDGGSKTAATCDIVPGANILHVSVKWSTGGVATTATYSCDVYIRGPRGTQP